MPLFWQEDISENQQNADIQRLGRNTAGRLHGNGEANAQPERRGGHPSQVVRETRWLGILATYSGEGKRLVKARDLEIHRGTGRGEAWSHMAKEPGNCC